MVDSPATDDPLDEAFAAYLRTCDAGELTSREDFLSQFPELADQLRELMTAADLIGRVTLTAPETDRKHRREVSAAAETVALPASGNESQVNPAVTLPMANRAKDDSGPTLPYELGDYQLLDVIGRGGMGVVYVAKQTMLDRMVAVKMIRSGMLAGESEVRRFYTEAQAAARLRHPGIVAVHQFGHLSGHHYFSMEYIEGTDLQRLINHAVLDPREAARYVRDVARAIHHAHQAGVLHRDLKPANVLIDKDDQIHVTDFGLAKHLDADSSVTGSGAAVGTPHYMAPEQAGGHSDQASRRSDVYSLGAILFACVSGRPPLVGETVMQTLLNVVHKPAPTLRSVQPDAPADLETVVGKCLEKEPGKRYSSTEDLARDLDAFLEGRPISARPRSRLLRLWNWFEDVPLVAALSGRRSLEISPGHRRFQTAMLALLLMLPFVVAAALFAVDRYLDSMPRQVRIAGGLTGGVYNEVSSWLADALVEAHSVPTQVIPSNGSLDNRRRLLDREVDLAPMQASAIRGDVLCVVAPLFYEAVHVLARVDSGIDSIDQLAGHRIAVGPRGSGSRLAAELVFDSLGLSEFDAPREVTSWPRLGADDAPDVAVICIGRGSSLVSDLLASRKWKLLPIDQGVQIGEQHPTLLPMTIQADEYRGAELPVNGVPTVGTTAFLAARRDTPAELVTGILEALYRNPNLKLRLIPEHRASEWQDLLAFHPAARRYFDRNEATTP